MVQDGEAGGNIYLKLPDDAMCRSPREKKNPCRIKKSIDISKYLNRVSRINSPATRVSFRGYTHVKLKLKTLFSPAFSLS